jgi:hypothetical protein
LWIRSNHCDQVSACTGLPEYRPADFFDASTFSPDDPGRITVFVDNLFDFFRLHPMPGYVLDVVFIPFRLQLLEPHVGKISQGC